MKRSRIIIVLSVVLLLSLMLSSCDKQLAEMIALAETETSAVSDTEAAPEPVPAADPQPGDPDAPSGDDTTSADDSPAPAEAKTVLPMILGYGVSYNCVHRFVFNQSYHGGTGPNLLPLLVGEDEFAEWQNIPTEKTDECDFANKNIYELIRHFEVTREQFTKWYYSTNSYYLCDYDIDLLYSSTADAVEAFYRSSGNMAEMMNRYGMLKIKVALEDLVGREAYAGYIGIDTNDETAVALDAANREAEWCIADFVRYFDIKEDQLVGVISSCLNETAGREVAVNQSTTDGGRYILPDAEFSSDPAWKDYSDMFSRINLDRLYTEEGSEPVSAALESGEYPVLVDEMICTEIEN